MLGKDGGKVIGWTNHIGRQIHTQGVEGDDGKTNGNRDAFHASRQVDRVPDGLAIDLDGSGGHHNGNE